MPEAKRKTYTSSAVKNRYNAKTYTQISASVHRDVAEAYKAKCKKLGISYSEPFHKAIKELLEK